MFDNAKSSEKTTRAYKIEHDVGSRLIDNGYSFNIAGSNRATVSYWKSVAGFWNRDVSIT